MAVDNNCCYRNSLPSAGRGTDDGGASSPGPSPETLREVSPLGSPLPLDLGAALDSRRQEEDDGDIEVKGEMEENWANQVVDSQRQEEETGRQPDIYTLPSRDVCDGRFVTEGCHVETLTVSSAVGTVPTRATC